MRRNKDFIVVGLGKSAEVKAELLKQFITIGVNDVSKFFDPDYLVVLDKALRFTPIRKGFIENTNARVAYVCHPKDWEFKNSEMRINKLETEKFTRSSITEWVEKIDAGPIPHYLTSPFAAIGLAYQLGAKRIGVIGMDLLPTHHMGRHAGAINRELAKYRRVLEQKGVSLFNCSNIARLPGLPYMDLLAMLPRGKKHE